MDEYDLENYYVRSYDEGTLVLVLIFEDRPVSLMVLMVNYPESSVITLDIVVTEQKYQSLGFGTRMVELGCSIGGDLGMKEIRLDAMSEELRDWYRDDTGFVELGREFEFEDPELGHMIPMRKKLP